MRRAMMIILFLLLICSLVWSQSYSGGVGTSGDPYHIATKADLKYLSENASDWIRHFKQTADIVFEAADFESGGDFYNNGTGFSPIGNATISFNGSFNGQGYLIKGLFINRNSTDNIGLFGRIRNATISNLKVFSADITGQENVGIAIGSVWGVSDANRDNSTLNNISITGLVYGSGSVGGLIGRLEYSNASISNCHTNVNAEAGFTSGSSDIGGLIGRAYIYVNPTVERCSARGTVTGYMRNVGGLIGYIHCGTVRESYSYADLSCSSNTQGNIGGFMGGFNSRYANGLIEDCYSTGVVAGGSNNSPTEWHNGIGGFVGTTRTEYTGLTKIIRRTYSTGSVSQTGSSTDIGGFLGRIATGSNPTVTNSYWDTQTSGQSSSAGNRGTGRTTAQMKIQSNYSTWDFDNVWAIDPDLNSGYPYLKFQTFPDFPAGITSAEGDIFIYPSVDLFYAASQSLDPFPAVTNPDFIPFYSVVLQGTGTAYIRIDTAAGLGACYHSGQWHYQSNTDGAIIFTGVNFDAKADVPILIGYEDTPLSVVLSSFTAVLSVGMTVTLHWVVESETNLAGYNILRNTSPEPATASLINLGYITAGQQQGSQFSYQFADIDIQPSTIYYYWLERVNIAGEIQLFGPISVVTGDLYDHNLNPTLPMETKLLGAYPNPFNPNTTITYALKEGNPVRIDIFNLKGQIVRSLTADHPQAGRYSLVWDGRDDSGKVQSSGIYVYRFSAGSYTEAKRFSIIK